MQDTTAISIQGEREAWGLIKDQSTILFQSKCLPSNFTNIAQIIAVVQYGRELEISPMTAINNIILVNGKPSLSANMIGAKLKQAGYKIKLVEYTDKVCTINFISPDGDQNKFSYTWDDAVKAKLTGKDNWVKYPKNMLYARALSMGGRMFAPEILMGAYSVEEMQDVSQVESQDYIESDSKATETTEKTQIEVEVVGECETPTTPSETPKNDIEQVEEVAEVEPLENKTLEDVEIDRMSSTVYNAWDRQIDEATDSRKLTSFKNKFAKMNPSKILNQEQINKLLSKTENKLSSLK